MESEDQVANSKAGEGRSKEGESVTRHAKEELGQEQEDEEEMVQQEDVVAKQAKKKSSKKSGGRLANGSYKTDIFFSEMLNDFDREYLIVLYRLFNEKYASTRPGFNDLMLLGDMKIMFEPDGDNEVWKNYHSQEL
nr:hypothetical protein [Tanacetum cinerariifolium]